MVNLCPGHFTLGRNPSNLQRRLCGPHSQSARFEEEKNLLHSLGFEQDHPAHSLVIILRYPHSQLQTKIADICKRGGGKKSENSIMRTSVIYNLYQVLLVINSKRMSWVRQAAHMGRQKTHMKFQSENKNETDLDKTLTLNQSIQKLEVRLTAGFHGLKIRSSGRLS